MDFTTIEHVEKEDGSNQWQDGYPNPDVIQNDIDQNHICFD
jgi:hypothetical protein